MLDNLIDGFDPNIVAAIEAAQIAHKAATGNARATAARLRISTRRAKSEAHLFEILPARIDLGESVHVVSHGDVDALSFLAHVMKGTTHFDAVTISTWCIARPDLEQLQAWLDAGRIDNLHLCLGEIFPSQYGDEHELAKSIRDVYGIRLTIAKNHSKVTTAINSADGQFLSITSSANVNTNPRIEQTTIHNDEVLYEFYTSFFDNLKSIDRG